jgi:hypothetical protein
MDYSNLPNFINALPMDDQAEPQQVQWIREKFGTERAHGSTYKNLASRAQLHGFYSWYVEHDLNALKQWFYLASRLRAESCKYQGGWDMWIPQPFIFPLLTDCAEIIQTYSHLTTENNGQFHQESLHEAHLFPKEGRFGVRRLQSVLQGDWQTVEQMKETFYAKIPKPQNIDIWQIEFFDALKAKEQQAIVDIIQQFLHPKLHKNLNKNLIEQLSGEVWSNIPVMFLKLAWMHGMEIEIDNPLVPMELMPIKPLAVYDDVYDFLKPDFKAEKPKIGLLSKLFGK